MPLKQKLTSPYSKIEEDVPAVVATSQLGELKVNELVTVRGLVLFDNSEPQQIPNNPHLTKLEGSFVDFQGMTPITIWNDHIKLVQDGEHYEIQNIRVKQYNGKKYLSSTYNTVFKPFDPQDADINAEVVEKAKESLQLREISCKSLQSVEILKFFKCVKCAKKVQTRKDSALLKCDSCHCRFLAKNCTSSTLAKMTLKDSNEQLKCYTLFPENLKAIINKHNDNNNCFDELDEMDEDKLCEIILTSEDMKLIVNANDNIVKIDLD